MENGFRKLGSEKLAKKLDSNGLSSGILSGKDGKGRGI